MKSWRSGYKSRRGASNGFIPITGAVRVWNDRACESTNVIPQRKGGVARYAGNTPTRARVHRTSTKVTRCGLQQLRFYSPSQFCLQGRERVSKPRSDKIT
jgi:hypothetical protein